MTDKQAAEWARRFYGRRRGWAGRDGERCEVGYETANGVLRVGGAGATWEEAVARARAGNQRRGRAGSGGGVPPELRKLLTI